MSSVDIHAHVDVPEIGPLVAGQPGFERELSEQLATFGAASIKLNIELSQTSYRPMLDDLGHRLGLMDAARVDIQAVSVSPVLYHYWAEEGLAKEIVAIANDSLVSFVGARPDRFAGLATVALQHPELAAAQLQEAMGRGLRGVEISTCLPDRELDDRSLDPFWTVAEELGAFVFIHPWGCSLGSRLAPAYLGNVVGNPTETTVALTRLVFGGVLDRFPGLTICGAHGGGYFPHYLGRADHAYEVRPESRTMERRPSEYLDSLHVDSLIYQPGELRRLVEVMGAEHVLLGSDYPYDMSAPDPVDRLEAADLGEQATTAIVGGNAVRLLGL